MEDNKTNQTKKEIEQAVNAVKKAKSGNMLGAAKELLKDGQWKKKVKKKLIGIFLKYVMPFLAVGIILICISYTLADKMGQLLTYISTSVAGLWQWMTDDYWIDLDEKIQYIVDEKTGQVIGTKNGAEEVTWNPFTGVAGGETQNEDELPEGTKIEEYTLIDKYIRDLGDLGFSIKDLRLLGDGADYSNMDKLLEDEDNKRLVEKYIAEFVRADIITQEFHKRRGTELVEETHQNLVDGGIYLYRTKKEETITEDQFANGNYEAENVEVKDKDFKQMEYIDLEKFREMVAKNDKDVRYKFSVDRQTGELLVAKMTSTQVVEEDVSNTVNKWFADLAQWLSKFDLAGTSTYEIEEVRIPYKEYISKYTMPYEFLINLCEWTQNPEFAYHVALLARDTKIVLVIQDDTTIERETIEIEEDRKYYRNESGPQTAGATVTDATPKTKKTRKTTTVTTQTPVLRIEYADTWSFYEEFEYTKNIKGTLEEEGPIVEKPTIPSTLSGYQPPVKEISYDPADGAYEGAGVEVTRSEYWYDTFVTERRIKTQMITTTTTYNEPIIKNSVEKSKQFLGLLQNDDGECPYDCFEEYAWSRQNPMALYCSQKAVFNRKGVFVQYKIPNMERWESPYSRLTCAVELTYSSMQLAKDEDEYTEDYQAQLDYESMYNQKMQGLVEHLQYLMTFPENESYTLKDLILDTIWDDDDEDDEDDEDDDEIPDFTWDGTTDELIEMLGRYAHEDMQESGILASVTVAQALLESGWGKSQLSATYNNYFGIKAGKSWSGPTVTMNTKEVVNGKTITVKAKFRVYDSPLASMKDHSRILCAARYSGVKGERNYKRAIKIIKNGGYATDPHYVSKICNIIEQYGLTRFD